MRPKDTISRFWSKVDKHSGLFWNGTECWMWLGAATDYGHGVFNVGGRIVGAHRFAWELVHGPIPDDLFVCHHCDRPGCLRDEHHFLGTQVENMADMVAKGRAATGDRNGKRTHPEMILRGDDHPLRQHPESVTRGSNVPWAKLTEQDVREMRRLRAAGMIFREIAERFGVSLPTAYQAVAGTRWKHVA